MAILKTLPGVKVTIEVASEPLHEYEDTTSIDDFDTVTRYIEARDDQTFEIKINNSQGATRGAGLLYEIVVDGNISDDWVLQPADCPYEYTSVGWAVDNLSHRKYKFSQFLAGEHGAHKLSADVEDLGIIEIDVYHLLRVHTSDEDIEYGELPAALIGVSEKTTKGKSLTHTIGFGDAVPNANIFSRFSVERMTEEPIAVFKFLYRSREALKTELIIPRTPSPPPLEERNVDLFGRDDITEMQKQLKAMKEKMQVMAKIKQEDQEDNPRPRKAARPSAEQEVIELD